MNQTAVLVNEWAVFEANHPGADINDFCRHRLISASQRAQTNTGRLVGGVVPNIDGGLLMKIIGRISKINMYYQNKGLEGSGLTLLEEFGMMITIQQEKNPRKTDIIYASLFELSSGSDMLRRLVKRGLIKEYTDKSDKRSKRVELTAAGEKAIKLAKRSVGRVAKLLTADLSEDDKQLCIQLLKGLEIKYSALWQQHRGKPIEDIHSEQVS